jgi:hypothetical protein
LDENEGRVSERSKKRYSTEFKKGSLALRNLFWIFIGTHRPNLRYETFLGSIKEKKSLVLKMQNPESLLLEMKNLEIELY